MTNGLAKMRQITGLTDAVFAAQQAKLAAIQREVAKLQDQLDQLDGKVRQPANFGDPAQVAGADIRWQTWAEARRRALLLQMARLRARQEDARAKTALAFGRKMAAEALLKRTGDAAKLRQARKALP